MNRTNIEFCDFTWNPIVGCRIGCTYCWARRWNARHRFTPHFEEPRLFPERLDDPVKRKKPAKIFVCSMGDIFSPGVKDSWVYQVIETMKMSPQHTFQLLTKRPEYFYRYEKDLPANCWLGTSIDYAHNRNRVDTLSKCSCKFTRFVLVEPLLSYMTAVDFSNIDLLYVGAQTGPKAIRPMKEWIYSIKHPAITYKENIKPYL